MDKYLGAINKIIPFSCVDGPGNRSAIFFQGCGFNCIYCHNPETKNHCNHCKKCVKVCQTKALNIIDDKVFWEKDKCCNCDLCIRVCENKSTPKISFMTVDEVFNHIDSALPYINGITVSGGECTLQEKFITQLFKKAKTFGKTSFVDTNGQNDFSKMKELTKEMDMAMLDIKAYDKEEHISLTGISKDIVFENFEYLASINKLYEVRTVILPEYLDNKKTVIEVGKILRKYPNVRYKLIKCQKHNIEELKNFTMPSDDYMKELYSLAYENGARNIIIT